MMKNLLVIPFMLTIIAKFEDTLGTYKDQSFNRVVKKWISLASKSSSSLRTSIPLRESSISTGPRALLYYYYGDQTKGSLSIQNEMSS